MRSKVQLPKDSGATPVPLPKGWARWKGAHFLLHKVFSGSLEAHSEFHMHVCLLQVSCIDSWFPWERSSLEKLWETIGSAVMFMPFSQQEIGA